jgi:hypothetical protein
MVTNTGNWTGGAISSGNLTIPVGSTLIVSGSADHDMNSQSLVNNGTVLWTGGRIRTGGPGDITNVGAWQDQANSEVNRYFGGGFTSFINLGTYTKSGTGTTTFYSVALDNSGTMNIQAGTLEVTAGGTNSATGIFTAQAPATINFSRATITSRNGFLFSDGSQLTGTGTVNLVSGTNTLTGTISIQNLNLTGGTNTLSGPISAPNLNLTGGTLAGTQTITGAFNWSGGNMNSAGTTTIASGSTLTISTVGFDHDMNTHSLINNGTVLWTAGRIRTGSGDITNANIWQDQANSEVNRDFGGGFTSFINLGTYTKSGTAGTTTFNSVSLDNPGTIEVQSGTLQLNWSVVQLPGSTLTGGTWRVFANSSLNITTGANITTNQGSVTLDGAGSLFPRIDTLATNALGGSFTIKNGRNFTTVGDFTNNGTLGVGSGSIFTVTGNYTQGSGGTLEVQIGGPPASGQFGQLAVTGTARLAGTLTVSLIDPFMPDPGDGFAFMTFASATGTCSVNLPLGASLEMNSTNWTVRF